DIQGNALLATHHASALQEHAPAGTTCGVLREKVAQRITQETELSLDPAWFQQQFPSIGFVETQLRRGKVINETTVYHYDVILHNGTPATRPVPEATEWKNLNLEQLEAMLMEGPDAVRLASIPDARLAAPLAFRKALESAATDAPLPAMPAVPSNAVSAEALFAVAAQCGYRAHVRWHNDGTEGILDAVFYPASEKALPAWPALTLSQSVESYANTPKSAKNPGSEMAPVLRKHLAGQLPEYMIPSAFVVLDAFPLTPNGKVDRKALPAPASYDTASADREIVAPRNETETKLVDIWKQVLGNDRIGIEDDIFELGGDSILIFQITTRATRAGIALTPAQVFRLRTIAAISSDASAPAEKSSTSTIQRVNRDAYRRNL
ncbi:MAG: non-ribosomal peptide synthetase, partial [Verrucomicrobiaceae bacterium]